jgi:hypothetical protein
MGRGAKRSSPSGPKEGFSGHEFQAEEFLDLVVIVVAIIVAQVLGGA